MTTEKTYWNGEPAVCRRVRVIVGKAPIPTWWCAKLEGTERDAVEVRYDKAVFYIDDDEFAPDDRDDANHHKAGGGWFKVTEGRGGPDYYHASLPVSKVLVAVCQEGQSIPQ